jgi:hypothetical protein
MGIESTHGMRAVGCILAPIRGLRLCQRFPEVAFDLG